MRLNPVINGLYVRAMLGVPKRNAVRIRELCRRFENVVKIDHVVPVMIIDGDAIEVGDQYAAAVFCSYRRASCLIVVAGFHPHDLANSLAHELAHYEQWRDNRSITERGVTVRARNLVKHLEKT